MGNSCVRLRSQGYTVVHGDQDELETAFSDRPEEAQERPHSGELQQDSDGQHALLTLASSQHPDTPPLTKRESTYNQALEPSKLTRSDSLEHLLECAICLDFLFEPVLSPCKHAFCKQCLRRLLEYEGSRATCPKCRGSLSKMKPDTLEVDKALQETVQRSYDPGTVEQRSQEAAELDTAYEEAKQQREEREHLMEHDPLRLMFDGEEDGARRLVLQRDLAILQGLGFPTTLIQKALFVSSGSHADALSWLVHHQHHASATVPWNMTQLQHEMALRNTRRALNETLASPRTQVLVHQQLQVTVSLQRLAASYGEPTWTMYTSGFAALGQPEIVVLLGVAPGETAFPDSIVSLVKQAYRKARDEALVVGHSVVLSAVATRDDNGVPLGSGLLESSRYTGLLLVKSFGHPTQGFDLPNTPCVFGILLQGSEIDWATQFPSRFLLQIGGTYLRADYPFPLVNHRERPVAASAATVRSAQRFASAMFVPGSASMRVLGHEDVGNRYTQRFRRFNNSWLLLLLPNEFQSRICDYIEALEGSDVIPLLTDVPYGADSFLVYTDRGHRTHALPESQHRVMGSSGCILRRDTKGAGTGGSVFLDTLLMSLSEAHFISVRNCLITGSDIDVRASQRSRSLSLSLRIRWLPARTIATGLAHVTPDLFPERSISPLALELAMPVDGLILPVIATNSSAHEVPVEMNPRIKLLSVSVGEEGGNDGQHVVENFLPSLLNRVDSKISKLLLPEEDCRMMPPSMLTIHVDLLPLPDQSEATSDGFPSDATYRISKSWDAVCPQGPEIKMRNWGHILHPIPTPSIPHRVCFAVTLRIS
eukprot:m.297750 g.297750  ORF g.297750 m.297750 type:complete len:822 (-) comp15858_c6_seq46:1109-3574(-)